MTTARQDALVATWNACGYYRLVGMRVVRVDDRRSELDLVVGDEHLQAYGTAHGGITAGLLDAAMGLAVLGRTGPLEGCATVGMTVSFTAPARHGTLSASGRVAHMGRRLVTATAEARDAEGVLVAVGQGTFARFAMEEE
ncbi:MAG: PaaI family thioesterase [Solirubrobacterales bacterium]